MKPIDVLFSIAMVGVGRLIGFAAVCFAIG
jgi:hypothetical protein